MSDSFLDWRSLLRFGASKSDGTRIPRESCRQALSEIEALTAERDELDAALRMLEVMSNELREVRAERDALRAQVERVRKAALDAVAYGDDISPQDVLDALEGEP